MPFETRQTPPRRIAVIGGGISGMGAAHALADRHHVVLFEAEGRLGGHARTVMAGKRGDQPVDTGFIVFNKVNYPHMVKLFADLDVPVADSNMSFGASFGGGRFEYALKNLDTLFAQRKNALNPAYLRMLADIYRFNSRAVALADDPGQTIARFLERLGTGPWFRDYYILPLSGAIWSTPKEGILDFPADAMIRFFQNHALLSATGQHPWFTVQGGSVEYVKRLQASLAGRGVDLRLGAAVGRVRRTVAGAEVTVAGQGGEPFDEVVFATHSDQALALLDDPSDVERDALSAVRYQPNRAVLHCDVSMMPKNRKAWASWVYTEGAERRSDRIDLTYWMNSLQPIPGDDPLFVTLNSQRRIDPASVHDTVDFMHPVYDLPALAAQETIRGINGQRATWFCGAWMRNGFHEDGLSSGYDVADGIARRVVAG